MRKTRRVLYYDDCFLHDDDLKGTAQKFATLAHQSHCTMVQNNSVNIWAKIADILNEPRDRESIHTECIQNKYRYLKMDISVVE